MYHGCTLHADKVYEQEVVSLPDNRIHIKKIIQFVLHHKYDHYRCTNKTSSQLTARISTISVCSADVYPLRQTTQPNHVTIYNYA